MSTGCWRVCPRCKVRKTKKVAEMYAQATESYGKASPEDYLKSLKVAEEFAAQDPEETLREDYEISTDERGEFFVSYYSGCDVCGLSFTFKHSEDVLKGK